jgi:hypothetical protein
VFRRITGIPSPTLVGFRNNTGATHPIRRYHPGGGTGGIGRTFATSMRFWDPYLLYIYTSLRKYANLRK